MQSQFNRPGRHWFVSDGFIWDDAPPEFRTETGRPWECSSQCLVFNPQKAAANVTLRFFHVDREPTEIRRVVPAGRILELELGERAEIPHRQAFWIELVSDVPVLPQAIHADFNGWHPVPDALCAVQPYPGPLEDETHWIFADGYQGADKSWHEREMLTILNPFDAPAKVHIQYHLRWRDAIGEETLEIPPRRVAALDQLHRRPGLLDAPDGPWIHIHGDYATVITSDRPIIAQLTRRARWNGRPSIVGSRSYIGHPLRAEEGKLWYYPGGDISHFGALPHGFDYDQSWNLLFTFNPHEKPAAATITFHHEAGHTSELVIAIPPQKSDLQWLHAQQLNKHVYIGRPYAMTLRSDLPVVPEVCGAEQESWSQNCPGAMTAVNLYPGPLTGETNWWLGIGYAGGADDRPTEWRQRWHFMNPGEKPVAIEVSFLGAPGGTDGEIARRSVNLAPGAVQVLASADIPELPLDAPFAVRATGDGPFCPQTIARTFTRGIPQPLAMYSALGLPMRLA